MDIKKKLDKVPESCGVYIFFGKNGEVLYIGKAKNLRKRMISYFQKRTHPLRIEMMISQIRDFDYIPTSSTAEALIYEAQLVRSKKPKYNVELKDDKSYPYLKFTIKDKFPRLYITREKTENGSLYYGPYTNVKLLRKALKVINSLFLLRSCRNIPKKPCLKAQIAQCTAPCTGNISQEEYRKIAEDAKCFLEGKRDDLLKRLTRRMYEASASMNYEKALELRGKVESLNAMWKGKRMPPPLDKELKELKETIGLKILPSRIEAFDISDIYGKEAVGSMVSFFSGRPQKDEYRRFRIKTVKGIDDYGMIREVIRRRYTRLLNEGGKLPDLIMIDGGRGHLNVARNVLHGLGLRIPVISIAKVKEEIYCEHLPMPLRLGRHSDALKLLMRIRDEAHRFAISYHKLLRGKHISYSLLDNIKGIGMARKKALINRFGSLEEIRKASIKELTKLRGINEKLAKKIKQHLKKKLY